MSYDNALQDWTNTQEMQQAMSFLNRFSEKDRQYSQYQARHEYLREQRSLQRELEEALHRESIFLFEKEAANQRESATLPDKAEALAEIEHLKALLEQKSH